MSTLSLRIPQALHDALRHASARRQMPQAALVREVLEQNLTSKLAGGDAAAIWVARWRGALAMSPQVSPPSSDDRVAHILAKHAP